MKTKTATSAGGVIVDVKGRVVLTGRRSFRGDLNWGLPKGLVEKGETPEEAAAREATEETGLEVQVAGKLRTIDYWFVDSSRGERIHKFVHFFLMRPVGGDPSRHDSETEEVAILDGAEALERASFDNEKEVIRLALEAID